MKDNYPEIPDFIKKLMDSEHGIDELKIDAEGNWFHNGEPFTNEKVTGFFNKSIDITKDGTYVIHYNKFVYPIVVEDAPVFITGVKIKGKDSKEKIHITLTTDEVEILNIKSLHYKNSSLYCYVKKGKLLAKFKRSPSFELLYRLEETDDIYFINICGQKLVLAEKV